MPPFYCSCPPPQIESAKAVNANRDDRIAQLSAHISALEAAVAGSPRASDAEQPQPGAASALTPPRSPGATTPTASRSGGGFFFSSKKKQAAAAVAGGAALTSPPGNQMRSPAEQSAAEKLARERLREAELALETQQRMYKAHISDLTSEIDSVGVGSKALGGTLAEMDSELARKEERLRALRADLEQLTELLTHAQPG